MPGVASYPKTGESVVIAPMYSYILRKRILGFLYTQLKARKDVWLMFQIFSEFFLPFHSTETKYVKC